MPEHLSRRSMALAGTVLLLAVVTAGCGRRAIGVDAASATQAGLAPASTTVALEPGGTGTTAPAGPAASPEVRSPTATAMFAPTAPPAATPPPVPLATPDLTAVQQLLVDLDAALGADATADTDEGSAP